MTLKRKILATFGILTLLVFAGYWFIFRLLAMEQLSAQNAVDLANFADVMERGIESGNKDVLQNITAGLSGMRITIVAKSGKVLFDSFESADRMENHLKRDEIQAALSNGSGISKRYSDTFKSWMNYYARKISSPEGEIVLRIASPLNEIEENFKHFASKFLMWVVPFILVLSMLGLWLTKRLFSPIESIIKFAGQIKFDEFPLKMKFPLHTDSEVYQLSHALNEMGQRLGIALADIQTRREELSQIVEALPVGVILIDKVHKTRYINTVARKLLGETSAVAKGTLVNRLLPNREMNEMLTQPDKSEDFYFPQRQQHIKVTSVSVGGTGKLLVIRDLTKEKNIEEIRRNFIIDAGHEFQTPLTIIRMAAELLQGCDKDETQKNNLKKIINSQERLTELVDELLLLTRADSLVENETQKIDISKMLRDIVASFEGHPSFAKTRFEFDIQNDVFIDGYPEEFKRAISNIVENAVKYSQEQENPLIKIALRKETEGTKIIVADNGVGISNEMAQHIFDPFRRGDAARAKGGYGLGLSISKRVIEAHGGKILVSSIRGEGSTFTVEI